ncbi:MAG: transposase [Planctomycetota bacterium]
MRKTRHSEEQIIGILKEAAAGVKVADLIRKHGISEQTFYRWKSKMAVWRSTRPARLRLLEDENRRLKQMVADLSLDNQALKSALGKEWWSPSGRRDMADYFEQDFGMSQRRASSLAQVSRSVLRYRSKRGLDSDVREQLEPTAERPRPATAD